MNRATGDEYDALSRRLEYRRTKVDRATQNDHFPRQPAAGHESYHWNTVAGADNITYGSGQCQSLARSWPNDALRNASNYAYAADTPP